MIPEFKIGDRVRWQYRGEERTGQVIEVVHPNREPRRLKLKPVERLSYIVETWCGKRYRPLDLDPLHRVEKLVELQDSSLRLDRVDVEQAANRKAAKSLRDVLRSAEVDDAKSLAVVALYSAAFALAVAVAAIFIAIRGL